MRLRAPATTEINLLQQPESLQQFSTMGSASGSVEALAIFFDWCADYRRQMLAEERVNPDRIPGK